MAVTRSSHARASEMTCNKPNASPRRMRKQKTKSSPLIADTKAQAVTKTSRFFQVVAPLPVQKPARPVSNFRFGLVQEEIQGNLYYLLVQSVLWCQTWGKSARPVLDTILSLYPTPEKLAQAKLPELTLIIYPIGLHNIRAKRLIDLAKMWLAAPPCKERRYRKVGYPGKGSGKNVKPGEVLEESDPREGWEVAHLPGVGAYALDSYRIFHRDRLRGMQGDFEPEWKRVVATDKELRAWLVWKWQLEGFDYDIYTGSTKVLTESAGLTSHSKVSEASPT